jgi:hypothetical protein
MVFLACPGKKTDVSSLCACGKNVIIVEYVSAAINVCSLWG